MAKEKQVIYTDNDRAIVRVLKDAKEPMTRAQVSEVAGREIASGSFNSAVSKGLIAVAGKVDAERVSNSPVCAYTFVTDEVMKREDGKPWNYTDSEKEILRVAATIEGPFTLAQLSEKVGRKLSSGAINSLVNKKGNLAKTEEKVPSLSVSSDPVNAYVFVADIPTNA